MKNLFLFILIFFHLFVTAQNTTQLTGYYYSIYGKPLNNASVNCDNGAVGLTDPNGRLTMPGNFEAGREYTFTATKEGYRQITFRKQVNDFSNLGNFWLCPDTLNCDQLGVLIIKEIEENIVMYLNAGSGIIIDRPQHLINVEREDIGITYNITFQADGYCQETKRIKITGNDVVRIKLKKRCELNIVENIFTLNRRDKRAINSFFEQSLLPEAEKNTNKYFIEYSALHTDVLKISNIESFPTINFIVQGLWFDYTSNYNARESYIIAYDNACNGISQQELDLLGTLIPNPENNLFDWFQEKLDIECN